MTEHSRVKNGQEQRSYCLTIRSVSATHRLVHANVSPIVTPALFVHVPYAHPLPYFCSLIQLDVFTAQRAPSMSRMEALPAVPTCEEVIHRPRYFPFCPSLLLPRVRIPFGQAYYTSLLTR